MPINIAWGPIATVPPNVDNPTPAQTVDAGDNRVAATADLSGQPAGITYEIRAEYRRSVNDTWREVGGSLGTTSGVAPVDRQGLPAESGARVSPMPDPGVVGRQLRAVVRVSAAMTNVSGHVITST
jgi:hypothetical protein